MTGQLEVGAVRNGERDGELVVDAVKPGTSVAFSNYRPQEQPVRIVVLSAMQAERVSVQDLGGRRRLLMSDQQAVVVGDEVQVRSVGQLNFPHGVFPALSKVPGGSIRIQSTGMHGICQSFEAVLPEHRILASITPVHHA